VSSRVVLSRVSFVSCCVAHLAIYSGDKGGEGAGRGSRRRCRPRVACQRLEVNTVGRECMAALRTMTDEAEDTGGDELPEGLFGN
jgi:hypothetical protein